MKKKREAITQDTILLLFQQLSSLLLAGITLSKCLTLLLHTQEKKNYCLLIHQLRYDIENGKEFNQALRHFPQYFDTLTCHLIQIGEQTGTLDTMLARVCAYLDNKIILFRQIKQALIYPSLLIGAALIVIIIMLYSIVPRFSDIFEQLHRPLPFTTRLIVRLSALLHQALPFLILMSATGFILLLKQKTLQQPERLQGQLAGLPIVGKMVKKIMLARLTRNLSTILSAAVPLTEALMLVSSLLSSPEWRKNIHSLYADVNSGKQFYTSLASNPFYPPLLVQMTKTGEESGTLEQMLKKFADICEADIQRSLHTFNQLLEPLIIIIVGVLIGGIVIAMYLPLFQLGIA